MAVVLHLVRHGETTGYASDLGLTARGRQQALDTGRELAATLPEGQPVRVLHAPTRRADETAAALHAQLPAAEPPVVEPGFQNITVDVDGRRLELTSAPRPHGDPSPGAERELAWFWAAHEAGDAMGFWLAQPLLHLESPVEVVRRYWTTALRLAAGVTDGSHLVVATHSGPMRALVATARGVDAGEPDNGEVLRLSVTPGSSHAEVTFRGCGDTVLLRGGPRPTG